MVDLYSITKDKVDNIVSKYHSTGLISDNENKHLSTLFIDSDTSDSYYDVGKPQTSNEVSYALYGRESNYLNEPMLPTNSINNNVHIKTANNLYLESNEDGQLNLNNLESIESKSNIIWTIINSDNSNFIRIKNYKDTYLKVTPRGIVENPEENTYDIEGIHNSWKLIKLDNENKYFIESNKYKNKRIEASLPVKISRGNTDAHKWIIEPIKQISSDNKKMNKLIKKKTNLITNYEEKINKNIEDAIFLDTLNNLKKFSKENNNKNNYNDSYNDIINDVKDKIIDDEIQNLKELNKIKTNITIFIKQLDQEINEKKILIDNEGSKINEQNIILNKNKDKYIKIQNKKDGLDNNSNIIEDSYYILHDKYKSTRAKKRILFVIKIIIIILLIIILLMLISVYFRS